MKVCTCQKVVFFSSSDTYDDDDNNNNNNNNDKQLYLFSKSIICICTYKQTKPNA